MTTDARIARTIATVALALFGCNPPSIMGPGGKAGGGGAGGTGGGAGTSDAGATMPPGGGPGAPAPIPPARDGGADGVGAAPPWPTEGVERCAHDVRTAKLSPIDLMLVLDASGSMAEKVAGRNRWEMARDALAAFLRDGRSSGLGVAISLFPRHVRTCNDDGTCFLPSPGGCRIFSACLAPNASIASGEACGAPGDDPCPAGTTCTQLGRCTISGGDCVGTGPCPSGVANDVCGARPRQCRLGPSSRGSCTAADYREPAVPFVELPAAEPRLTGAMETRLPLGATPLGPAVDGALAYLTAQMPMRAGRRAALVIVSDGVPEGCITDVPAIYASLRAASARNPPITTYVVGVFAGNEPPMARMITDQLAVAGGTATPFIVSANEQLTEKFLAALNQIRGVAVPCDLPIPMPTMGQIDFGKVNVRVSGGGGPIDLVYVGRRDRCDVTRDGWYYDVDPMTATPGRVHLCPGVCERLKADPRGTVEVHFGCKTRIIE